MSKYPNLVPRFLEYVKKETRSDENSLTVPSTQSQVKFAKELVTELTQIGLKNVRISAKSGYVFAELPSNLADDSQVKKIGLLAHMDTADFKATDINPKIVENYDGKSDISLDEAGEIVLSPKDFPNLKNYCGHNLITTDGTTLLGADDKAGIAEIVTAMEYLIAHPEIKHGTIMIGIGPDEEIGTGSKNFDVAEFGAEIAYTVDGGPLGELEYETFNAAQAKLKFLGKEVHPATAKDVMINAIQLAMDYHNMLPKDEVPEKTEGRQGFFHVIDMSGNVAEASLTYIIRDHDREIFEKRKQLMLDNATKLNATLGERRVLIEVKDQYYNMREVIEKDMTVVELAKKAMNNLGITPEIYPVRGGTDGSIISFMGLPTPNIFAGGENMHGRYEYVSVQTMEKVVDTLLEINRLNVKEFGIKK